uniref:FecR family protein n=1 Tax=Mucilaginibacter sp. Bleaf8 TaxID=2834430 RepID=UPI0020BE3BCB|nr:FecR family protein [Mucilaginibacter sp. Bleaf8]
MTNNRLSSLIQQLADNTISKDDFQELMAYLKLPGNDKDIMPGMDKVWDSINYTNANVDSSAVNEAYQKLLAKDLFHKEPSNIRPLKPWYKAVAAAVALIGIGIGAYFYIASKQPASIAIRYENDVRPGTDKATLTLADGRSINLTNITNGDLAEQSGIHIIKTHTGQLVYEFKGNADSPTNASIVNTITTPKGGQYQVILPDGSKVWLNTASSLKFPVKFNAHERRVQLAGEAYFEVAKDVRRPFRVVDNRQVVEVLGTHFNIHGYTDEQNINTTLIEGSVKVSLLAGNANVKSNQSLIIKPGQQAVSNNIRLSVRPADTEEVLAWKNGLFLYNNQTLDIIMKQVSRWYDVDVVYEDDDLKNQVFSGSLSRFKNISELLEVLETTGSVHFKIEGRRVTAMK